jgi:DNA-binding response OmpR family regulator
MRIATLESDTSVANVVVRAASYAGHECNVYSLGSSLIRALTKSTFDLIILDWSLPDMSGVQVVKWIRENLGSRVLVMLLTNQSVEQQIVAGLLAGADDYMTKPLRQRELFARLHSLARRHRVYSGREKDIHTEIVEVASFRFDTKHRSAFVGGRQVYLKPKEFDIAVLLFQHVGKVVSTELIGTTVWGNDVWLTSRVVSTHVSRIRKKLNLSIENNAIIRAFNNRGFRLDVF